ncbi:Aste57867_12130 [Aphanomyces stellatus]|uniref:Aste57867_12130 protein n=1 Tax=Aphanomyces stellatus TaxID=120398 RepID=A0A485KUS6_9STRA|nr:hypothetical protein As57867_012085 [Aphanomyces stellatus]VFT88984.1 Aste57867_12130 [Aphanomyces stellatus]
MEATNEERSAAAAGSSGATANPDLLHRRMDALERHMESLPERICLAMAKQSAPRDTAVDETLFFIRRRLETLETQVDRLSFGVSRVFDGRLPTPPQVPSIAAPPTEAAHELALAMRTLTTAIMHTSGGLPRELGQVAPSPAAPSKPSSISADTTPLERPHPAKRPRTDVGPRSPRGPSDAFAPANPFTSLLSTHMETAATALTPAATTIVGNTSTDVAATPVGLVAPVAATPLVPRPPATVSAAPSLPSSVPCVVAQLPVTQVVVETIEQPNVPLPIMQDVLATDSSIPGAVDVGGTVLPPPTVAISLDNVVVPVEGSASVQTVATPVEVAGLPHRTSDADLMPPPVVEAQNDVSEPMEAAPVPAAPDARVHIVPSTTTLHDNTEDDLAMEPSPSPPPPEPETAAASTALPLRAITMPPHLQDAATVDYTPMADEPQMDVSVKGKPGRKPGRKSTHSSFGDDNGYTHGSYGDHLFKPAGPVKGKRLQSQLAINMAPPGVYKDIHATTVVLPVHVEPIEPPAPKKRGPKKGWKQARLAAQQSATSGADTDASTSKGPGRGRKKKSALDEDYEFGSPRDEPSQPRKKIGRPRKAVVDDDFDYTAASPDETAPAKKKAGRPKGWTRVAHIARLAAAAAQGEMTKEGEGTPKRRGRKPKQSYMEPQTSPLKRLSQQHADPDETADEGDDEAEAVTPAPTTPASAPQQQHLSPQVVAATQDVPADDRRDEPPPLPEEPVATTTESPHMTARGGEPTIMGSPDMFEDILGPASVPMGDIPSPLVEAVKLIKPIEPMETIAQERSPIDSDEGRTPQASAVVVVVPAAAAPVVDKSPPVLAHEKPPKKKRGRPKGYKQSENAKKTPESTEDTMVRAKRPYKKKQKVDEPNHLLRPRSPAVGKPLSVIDMTSDTSEAEWRPTTPNYFNNAARTMGEMSDEDELLDKPASKKPTTETTTASSPPPKGPETPRTTAGDALVTLASSARVAPSADDVTATTAPFAAPTPDGAPVSADSSSSAAPPPSVATGFPITLAAAATTATPGVHPLVPSPAKKRVPTTVADTLMDASVTPLPPPSPASAVGTASGTLVVLPSEKPTPETAPVTVVDPAPPSIAATVTPAVTENGEATVATATTPGPKSLLSLASRLNHVQAHNINPSPAKPQRPPAPPLAESSAAPANNSTTDTINPSAPTKPKKTRWEPVAATTDSNQSSPRDTPVATALPLVVVENGSPTPKTAVTAIVGPIIATAPTAEAAAADAAVAALPILSELSSKYAQQPSTAATPNHEATSKPTTQPTADATTTTTTTNRPVDPKPVPNYLKSTAASTSRAFNPRPVALSMKKAAAAAAAISPEDAPPNATSDKATRPSIETSNLTRRPRANSSGVVASTESAIVPAASRGNKSAPTTPRTSGGGSTTPKSPLPSSSIDSTGGFQWKDGQFHRAPENWRCPASTCKTMWCYWFRGDVVNQIGPFRFLKANDVSDTNSRNLLARGRAVMEQLIKIATSELQAQSLEHISDMPSSEFMAIFDRSFDIMLGKMPDGNLTRDGFEKIRSEQVVYYMYGSVYEIMMKEKKKKKVMGVGS